MPMAGEGVRFLQAGFQVPKPLIQLNGKPFFYWATNSLAQLPNVIDVTFVVLQEHVDKFSIDEWIKKYFPQAKIVVQPEIWNGAVLTCMLGVTAIEDHHPIIFNDCDHAFGSRAFASFLQKGQAEVDGGLLTFKSNENKYSYVKYDADGKMIGTAEKIVVSDDAICGAYYFKSKAEFLKYAQRYLDHCPYQEFYLSGIYNEMCQDGKVIQCFETDFHLPFGVPEEYESAKHSEWLKRIES